MSLGRYHFAFTFDPSAQSVPDKTAFFSGTSLTILADNVHPAPRRRRLRDHDVFSLAIRSRMAGATTTKCWRCWVNRIG
jgi:hypothetical protein